MCVQRSHGFKVNLEHPFGCLHVDVKLKSEIRAVTTVTDETGRSVYFAERHI